jgi:aryl-alcohol dehydrogenase-like predicted oxidoreductase
MRRNRLGKSGLVVSEICMGTMTFGSMADEATGKAIMDKAFDAGVNFIDTAEMYPVPPDAKWAGRTEEICGKWLADRPRDSVIVASKVVGAGGGWFAGPLRSGHTGLDRWNIERAVEDSLRRLGTDYIDLYQTHWPDPDYPIEDTMEALDRVVTAGKVRYLGCSNQSAYGLTKALWAAEARGTARYETIQNNFSLLNRRFEDELAEVCRREQVGLLPYSPLAGGVLTGKYQDGAWPEGARFTAYRNDPVRGKIMSARFINEGTLESTRRLMGIASELDMSITTLAVAWTLTHDFVPSTIIGATTVDQLDDSLAAAGKTLPLEALTQINAISREIRYPMG